MMILDEIRENLMRLQDKKYRDLQIKTIPSVAPDRIIGVRTPELRSYAKELAKREDIGEFLEELPHKLFEEDQLHAFLLSGMKDYEECIRKLDAFLPFVDNWATCDQMSPKIFKKRRAEIKKKAMGWISSSDTYTIRFGIGMLMEHFLDEDFDPGCLEEVSKVRSSEYYVNMMTAWYFATALAKQYDAALPYIEERKLDTWTHNKAIQKAVESYRITPEQKVYLKTLKVKTRAPRP